MISSELNVLYVSLVFQGWITCSAGSNQETLLKHCRLCHGKGANWPCIHTDCVCQLIGKLYYTLPYHSTTGPSNTLRPTFQSVPKIVIPVFFSIQNIQTIPLRWCRLWTRRLPRNLLHRKKHDIVVSIKLHCFVISVFQISEEFHQISKDLLGTFGAAFDKHVPCLLKLYRARKGAFGQKMEDFLETSEWSASI